MKKKCRDTSVNYRVNFYCTEPKEWEYLLDESETEDRKNNYEYDQVVKTSTITLRIVGHDVACMVDS